MKTPVTIFPTFGIPLRADGYPGYRNNAAYGLPFTPSPKIRKRRRKLQRQARKRQRYKNF